MDRRFSRNSYRGEGEGETAPAPEAEAEQRSAEQVQLDLERTRTAVKGLAREIGQAATPYQEDFTRHENGQVVQRAWLVRTVKRYGVDHNQSDRAPSAYFMLSTQEVVTNDGAILERVQKWPVTKQQWQDGGEIPDPQGQFRGVDLDKLEKPELDDQWTSLRNFGIEHYLIDLE